VDGSGRVPGPDCLTAGFPVDAGAAGGEDEHALSPRAAVPAMPPNSARREITGCSRMVRP
jgi:hypothetical protein